MSFRIEIITSEKSSLPLPASTGLVKIVDVYTIDKDFDAAAQEKIAKSLSNPVLNHFIIKGAQPVADISRHYGAFAWGVEIGFLPGVTDNVAHTTKDIIEDLLHVEFAENEGVYSSRMYLFSAASDQKIVASLHNPLIQRAHIKSADAVIKAGGMEVIVPKVVLHDPVGHTEVDLDVSDEELAIIGNKGIPNGDGTYRGPLGLSLLYLKAIQAHFRKIGRKPKDIELETLAQTWSEHCKHTIFASGIDEITDGLYKHYIKRATQEIRARRGKDDICVSVFTDNSGAIIFDDKWLITDKVETHNSPSALDPFGGAITGIVGVNRDTAGFGKGAKPVINRYGYCFADPRTDPELYRGKGKTNRMLSPKTIMDGVVRGVESGGNCSGIPTPQGFTYFDQRYAGKPLVYVGTIGLIPRIVNGKPSHLKKAQSGDYIVMVGGRVGKDGIHGATFSSVALDEGSPATAVQIGDPITQKKFSDALIKEARDKDLYTAITDNGAGGLSSSIGEMGQDTNGFHVELDKVPLKYPGMTPWEIWISESQERMTLAVSPAKFNELKALLEKRGVEATVIGTFTTSGNAHITWHGTEIMDVSMDFLHNGLPHKQFTTTFTAGSFPEPARPTATDHAQLLRDMLARPNLCSKEWIAAQYDHEVQAGSVLKPLQGKGRVDAEATVTRPVLSSHRAVVLSHGITPRYGDIDSYHMAACAIDTAIRNAIAVGGSLNHLAMLDNFCWCSSEEPERLGQLKRAVQACYDLSVAYGVPLISGKDSMFNDFKGYDKDDNAVQVSIPPTLLISTIGVIEDLRKVTSLEAKIPGDLVYILGQTKRELGGSEYFWHLNGEEYDNPSIGDTVPQVDIPTSFDRYERLHQAINHELVASAISVNLGGLAIAAAKKAIGGALGMHINLALIEAGDLQAEELLYSETQGRFVVTIDPHKQAAFERIMGNHATFIGTVTDDARFRITEGTHTLVDLEVSALASAYKDTFKHY